MIRRLAFLSGVLALAACGQQDTGGAGAGPDNQAAMAESAKFSPLDHAAIRAGLLPKDGKESPIGLYRNRHETGVDSLCIISVSDKGPMRFGMEASFGENIECHGKGNVRQSGDTLIFAMEKSACLIVAHYDGDRIMLPGMLDTSCDRFCTERGSLEGVSFPRISHDAGVAAAARATGGDALCPG